MEIGQKLNLELVYRRLNRVNQDLNFDWKGKLCFYRSRPTNNLLKNYNFLLFGSSAFYIFNVT